MSFLIQKLAWASFFERLDAVFFVAPLECFDEWSDDNENELKHSMDLWGGVVRNEMLGMTPLVLIHNKIDLLREKLEAGTKVADHVVSFKGRPNEVETVVQCRPSSLQVVEYPGTYAMRLDFRHYFKQIYKSSTSSSKALKNLTSKLQSVGSTPSEPQERSAFDPPERVFKTYVAHDVSTQCFLMLVGTDPLGVGHSVGKIPRRLHPDTPGPEFT